MLAHRFLFRAVSILALSACVACGHLGAKDTTPTKLFDTHVHFVSSDFARYPVSTDPANAHEQMLRDYHLQTSPSTAEKVFSQWDANGVDGGVGVQYRTMYGTNNTYLLDTAAQHAGRVATVVILDAVDATTPDTLSRLAREKNIAGVRLTGRADAAGEFPWLDSAAAQRTWSAANELGLAVVLMPTPALVPNPPALERIARLAQKYPNVRIVLDHIGFPTAKGGPDFGLGAEYLALKAYRNIYYKFSTINIELLEKGKVPSADFVRHAVDVYGADHVMWGSDFGNKKSPYAELVAGAVAAASKLTPNEQRQFLHDTGKALFVGGGRGPAR
jgi:L-fuconolactonase